MTFWLAHMNGCHTNAMSAWYRYRRIHYVGCGALRRTSIQPVKNACYFFMLLLVSLSSVGFTRTINRYVEYMTQNRQWPISDVCSGRYRYVSESANSICTIDVSCQTNVLNRIVTCIALLLQKFVTKMVYVVYFIDTYE